MKLADEMRNICRRPPSRLYYDNLIDEIRKEAREGGAYKIVALSPNNYDFMAKKLVQDGFNVLIYNYNPENPSHMTYIVWDRPAFDKWLSEHEEMTIEDFRDDTVSFR
jgi:hypothetical protein